MIVALGHQAVWAKAPEYYRKAFFGAFNRLPKDFLVLFSYNADKPTNEEMPSNIRLVKWIPQKALLAHPKIRLFLTHVGANSLAEAVLNGVPMLALPLFADQPDGAARVESFGLGKKLHKKKLNQNILYDSIMELLENKTYSENGKKFAKSLENEPERALERAVFWTEYLARLRAREKQRGIGSLSMFLSSESPLLFGWINSIKYHSLDIIGFLALLVLAGSYVTIKCFCKVISVICKQKNSSS